MVLPTNVINTQPITIKGVGGKGTLDFLSKVDKILVEQQGDGWEELIGYETGTG